MNYYISDLHLGHANILKLDNRPFTSIEQHDHELIRRWNSVVTKDDTVYILGDLCWKKENEWARIISQLKGKKVLIRGNHDPKKMSAKTKALFVDIKDYKEIKDNGRTVIMCHYPIPFYKRSNNTNVFMLYGHVHTTYEWVQVAALTRLLQQTAQTVAMGIKSDWYDASADSVNKGQLYNVGAMMPWMNFTPRTLDQIIKEAY